MTRYGFDATKMSTRLMSRRTLRLIVLSKLSGWMREFTAHIWLSQMPDPITAMQSSTSNPAYLIPTSKSSIGRSRF